MKKNLLLIAAILLTGAFSCQKATEVQQEEMVDVVLEAAYPAGPSTRSYLDDASSLKELDVLVYEVGDGDPVYLQKIKPSSQKYNATTKKFELHVSVLKGYTYRFALVARSMEAHYYTLSGPAHTLTLGALPLNSANADFFVGVCDVEIPTAGNKARVTTALTLKRPLAQVNLVSIAEADQAGMEASVLQNLTFTMTVWDVPNVLDLFTLEASGSQQAAFEAAPRIPESQKLDQEGMETYSWLASAFVLAPKTGTLDVTVSWQATSGNFNYISNPIPGTISRNARLNIIGHILQDQPQPQE